ncbi:tetratricopeptide repeat protein [Winogradskyella sp.]|uniref:tetratricopeptide repeat protein n=1 Tax=Winogradskyella sp. TaxID=1883156 RepID=UPI0026076B4E|nr:tetratricopeptide repeat protein [Winogradskyella sp.]
MVEYILFLGLFFTILRPFTTLIHELGHGIPALIFTDKKVTLYLGSYGNPDKSFKVVFGRLELFFNKQLFNWNVGLCVMEEKTLAINKQIVFVLMGPLASLILSIVLTYAIVIADFSDYTLAVLFLVNISTYYDFFVNIVPSSRPIKLYNGSIVYNDGSRILELLKFKKAPEEYSIGTEYYNNKEYALAAKEFEKVLAKGYQEPIIYQLLISAYLQIKDNDSALRINKSYDARFRESFNSNDYTNMGLIKSFSGAYEEAVQDYDKAIELNPNNHIAYNNRGYTFNIMADYKSAIPDFEKAIELEENFAYALNNIGFAKIKLGFKGEGLSDLKKSMTLDGTNSYCYMNFGIYHYDNKEYEKALDYFEKAKELDTTTYLLDGFLEKTKEKLGLSL